MSKKVRDLPKVWFGCHRRETERLFRKLDALQNRVADELEERVKKERIRHEQLRLRLAELSPAQAGQAGGIEASEEAFAHLLQDRLGRSVEAITRQGEAEANALEQLMIRQKAEHKAQLQAIDKQLAEYEAVIERLLEEADAVIESLRSAKAEGIAMPITDTITRMLAAASAQLESTLPEPLHAEPDSSVQSNPEAAQMNESVAQTVKNAKVIELRLRSMLKTMEEAKSGGFHGTVTADDTSATSSASAAAGRWTEKVSRAAVKRPSSERWGEIDLFLTEVDDPELLAYWKDDPALQKKPSSLVQLDWPDPEPMLAETHPALSGSASAAAETGAHGMLHLATSQATAEGAETYSRSAIVSAADSSRSTASSVPASAHTLTNRPAQAELASPALTDEIKQIQLRYIVGKIAGESVYAQDGSLIAAKSEPITLEAVQAAERAGKLSELIVHMIIPSLGGGGR
ncbi:putative coiled-coil protein SlyX [Paenibacillus phyllosphaerae]|uniref:Putative coiled-coil protein SlyX n=1 Tax=Paenibacillus phyllosphaerae TaxID=274593 RepID=A0A7W5AU02_9BACL|nr:hypothetical protein [Paenibacillus phyllosphaerae]MBB3108750.1 putative coiled-coil protein SlyX [Paenibacillus phyllosphaerae]